MFYISKVSHLIYLAISVVLAGIDETTTTTPKNGNTINIMNVYIDFIKMKVNAKMETHANGCIYVINAKILQNRTSLIAVKASKNFRSCTIEAQLCQQNSELWSLIVNKFLLKTHAFNPRSWINKLKDFMTKAAFIFIMGIIINRIRVGVTKEK